MLDQTSGVGPCMCTMLQRNLEVEPAVRPWESDLEISGESVVQGPRGLEDLISEMHVMWE